MRVNIYAEELTDRVQIIEKTTADGVFTGVRFYLELPIKIPVAGGHAIEHRGPFIHRPGDDDSSAVTFWGKPDLRKLLSSALEMLDKHYNFETQNTTAGLVASKPLSHWHYVCMHCGVKEGELHKKYCPTLDPNFSRV